MGVSRIPKPLRGVRGLAMLDARLDTTRHIESVCEVSLGVGVLQLLVSDIAIGAIIYRPCAADRVEVTY